MYRRFLAAALLASANLTGPTMAASVAVSNGTYALITVRDCSLGPGAQCNETTGQGFSFTNVQTLRDYQPGAALASVAATHPLAVTPLGISGASIEIFDAATTAPSIGVGAFTQFANARVGIETSSVSGYSWNGIGDPARTVSFAMSYSASNVHAFGTGGFPALAPFSYLGAFTAVFSLQTPTFVVDDQLFGSGCSMSGIFALRNCLAAERADFRLEGESFFGSSGNSVDVITGSIAFTLEAGRFYFVDVGTQAFAKGGSFMDSTQTLTTSFSSISGLVALPAGALPVPEPGTMVLMAAGALALLRRARRSRTE